MNVTRGTVTFETDERLRLSDIEDLVNEAKVIGIPPSASVTHVSFSGGIPNGHTSISLYWEVKR